MSPSISLAPTWPTVLAYFPEVGLRLFGVIDFSDLLLQTKWIEITEQWMEDSILVAAPKDVEMMDVEIRIPFLRARRVDDTDSVLITFDIEMVFHIRSDTEVTTEALVVEPFYTSSARNGYVNRLRASESPLNEVYASSPLFGEGLKLPPREN